MKLTLGAVGCEDKENYYDSCDSFDVFTGGMWY